MARQFVGMDIGNEIVNLAFRSGGAMSFISKKLPDNAVSDGQIVAPQVLADFLGGIRREGKVRPKDCSVILHSYSEFFRHASMPLMSESELRLNLPYEFRDFITDDPAGYSFDYALDKVDTDDEGAATGLEVFAAATRRDRMTQLASCLKRAGFRLRVVNPSPMAYMTMLSGHVARHPEDAATSIALVDVGYSQMSVMLFAGTHFEGSRLIDMGVRDVDAAIADARGVDTHVAATYRARDYEGVLGTDVCQAVYDRMVFEVSKVVNFYNFSNQNGDIERMYLLGSGVTMDPFVAAMGGGFEQPVHLVTDLLPDDVRGQADAAVCARAYAALLCGEASAHAA